MERTRGRTHLRVPARASIWYCASALITKGIGFLMTPVFTRALTESEYGIYPLYLGWMSLFSAVLTLEIGSGALFGGFQRFGENEGDFTKSALASLVSTFLVLFLPIFIFSDAIADLTGLDLPLILIMAVHILADAVGSVFCTRQRFHYAYKSVFLANVLPALISPLIAIALIGTLPSSARIIASMLTSVAVATVLLFKMQIGKSRVRPAMMKHATAVSLTLFPTFLGTILLSNADKLMIGAYFGAYAVAKYSVAHSLGLVLTFFTVGLFGALKPWMLRKLYSHETDHIAEVCRNLLVLGGIGTLALAALAPELLALLAPRDYTEALGAVYFFALSVMPMFLTNVFASVLLWRKRAWISSLATLAVAFLNIGANAFLFKRFSFVVAAFTFLLSYIILALFGALMTRREGVMDKRVWIYVAICALGVALLYIIRRHILLRLVTLICLIPTGVRTARTLSLDVMEK